MVDYKAMYHKLSNAMTDAIWLLQEAQQGCEEAYMSEGEGTLVLLEGKEIRKDGQ